MHGSRTPTRESIGLHYLWHTARIPPQPAQPVSMGHRTKNNRSSAEIVYSAASASSLQALSMPWRPCSHVYTLMDGPPLSARPPSDMLPLRMSAPLPLRLGPSDCERVCARAMSARMSSSDCSQYATMALSSACARWRGPRLTRPCRKHAVRLSRTVLDARPT